MGKIYACIAWCPRCQRYSHEARKFNDLKIFCRQRYYIDGKDIDCETGLVIISEKCAEFGSKEISQYVTEQLYILILRFLLSTYRIFSAALCAFLYSKSFNTDAPSNIVLR